MSIKKSPFARDKLDGPLVTLSIELTIFLCMFKSDARRLDRETLTELRRRGVATVHDGQPPYSLAAALGVSRAAVYNWLAIYRSAGWGSLDARKRIARYPRHDGKALRWLYGTIASKDPPQLKFIFGLCSGRITADLAAPPAGGRLTLGRPHGRRSRRQARGLGRWRPDRHVALEPGFVLLQVGVFLFGAGYSPLCLAQLAPKALIVAFEAPDPPALPFQQRGTTPRVPGRGKERSRNEGVAACRAAQSTHIHL